MCHVMRIVFAICFVHCFIFLLHYAPLPSLVSTYNLWKLFKPFVKATGQSCILFHSWVCFCVHVALSFSLSLDLTVCLSVCLSLCLFLSLCLPLSHFLSRTDHSNFILTHLTLNPCVCQSPLNQRAVDLICVSLDTHPKEVTIAQSACRVLRLLATSLYTVASNTMDSGQLVV